LNRAARRATLSRMDAVLDELARLHWVDAIALGLGAAGLLFGALTGLARAFVLLLYLGAVLFVAALAAPTVLGWFPTSAPPDDTRALDYAYGGVAGVALLLPLVGKALGRGTPRATPEHRMSGALVGLAVALLVFVLTAPFLMSLSSRAGAPRSAELARAFGAHVSILFPEYHVTRIGG